LSSASGVSYEMFISSISLSEPLNLAIFLSSIIASCVRPYMIIHFGDSGAKIASTANATI